jgi:4-methyl-5(b-hydroxyethyl)-thiazole monophosphate biosynthesis
VEGCHGIAIEADAPLQGGLERAWDAVVLPGGLPGATNLKNDPRVRALLVAQEAAGRTVAAICAAPVVLAASGVLKGRRATCYPGFEAYMDGDFVHATDPVVEDGPVITSRGPGTALAFSLALAERLVGADEARAVSGQMLWDQAGPHGPTRTA